MGHPSALLPPAARAALPSAQEAPAGAAALVLAGGGAAPAAAYDVDTRDGAVRYAAYAGRTAQIMQRVASLRYLAYASDVGEAFRPTIPRWVVNATYGVAFGYVACDVTNQTVRSMAANAPRDEVHRVAAHATVFQLCASIVAPFLAIHTTVDVAKKALANTRIARHGPTAAGLALIPLLPLCDEPIETVVDAAFDAAWPRSAAGAAFAAAHEKDE